MTSFQCRLISCVIVMTLHDSHKFSKIVNNFFWKFTLSVVTHAVKKHLFFFNFLPFCAQKGVEPHHVTWVCSHVVLFTFSTAMLLALFHLIGIKRRIGHMSVLQTLLIVAVCKDSNVVYACGFDRNGKWEWFCESKLRCKNDTAKMTLQK